MRKQKQPALAVENGRLAVPGGLTVLDAGALEGVPEMDELEIPEGIRKIQSGAFRGCGARRVIVPSTVKFIVWPDPAETPALQELDIRCRATAGRRLWFPPEYTYRFTRGGQPLPFRDRAYIAGYRLFAPEGATWTDDARYLDDGEFRGLVRRASLGDAQGMRLLAEYYERLGRGEFSRVMANFWRYYAMLHGDEASERYWETWVHAHPGETVSIGLTLQHQDSGSLHQLRCCGFALPEGDAAFDVMGLSQGVRRLDVPDGHIDADEDGYGFERLYRHVYVDEYMCLIPDLTRYPELEGVPGDRIPFWSACCDEEAAIRYVQRIAKARGYVFA